MSGKRPPRTSRRAYTLPSKVTKEERIAVHMEGSMIPTPPLVVPRPVTVADCAEVERPCPWVGCKYHMYLDVHPVTGGLKINFPDLALHEMENTCCLDITALGGQTLEQVGQAMNMARERVRQIEVDALDTYKINLLDEMDEDQ